jgi:CDGSH-type Zn-finger protein
MPSRGNICQSGQRPDQKGHKKTEAQYGQTQTSPEAELYRGEEVPGREASAQSEKYIPPAPFIFNIKSLFLPENHNKEKPPMSEPIIAQKEPYVEEVEPKKYAWCACGRSEKQPYCDGTHLKTDLKPFIVEIKEKQEVAWCGCKHTGTKPFCDGTHETL